MDEMQKLNEQVKRDLGRTLLWVVIASVLSIGGFYLAELL